MFCLRLCEVALLLFLIKSPIASCDVFYIVTSPTSPCPGEFTGVPCLTLQQYASNPSRSENITFLVEPGTYNLSSVLAVSDGNNFTMSSTNATVVCTTTAAKFTFDTFENVHISGMTFQGCRSSVIEMNRVTMATITNTRFIQNQKPTRYGGCLYVRYSSVTFTNNEFLRNGVETGGGAIYAYSSMISIQKSVFNYNNGNNWGGAIYCTDHCNLTIEGSTFRQNTCKYNSGGAIHSEESTIALSNVVFEKNVAGSSMFTPYGYGGAIYMSGGTVSLAQCQFNNNNADISGGAIYKTGGTNDIVVINNTDFNSNMANLFGGAIYMSGTNSSVSVSSSFFFNNTAVLQGGGAIYTDSRYANVTMTSSTFTHNSASYCGVLDVDDFDHFSVDLTNNVFTHNTATGQTIGGGVACIRNASINIINSSFKHNSANYHAGVFYIDESVASVENSIFINNSAALDGGVFYTYIHASDYFVSRSRFSENSAGNDGGVIFIGRLNSHVSIDESIFDFNSAGNRGGVVALVASSMFMEINGSNIYNNTAQFGGVISACNSHVTLLDDTLYITVDPVYSFCTLYEGDIRQYNITTPQDPEVAMTTAAPPPKTPHTTTPPPTTSLPTTVASTTPATSHYETSVPTTNSPSTSTTHYPHTTSDQQTSTTNTPSTITEWTVSTIGTTTITTSTVVHSTTDDDADKSQTTTIGEGVNTTPAMISAPTIYQGSSLPVTITKSENGDGIAIKDVTTLGDKTTMAKPDDATNPEPLINWDLSTIISVTSLGVSLSFAIIVIVAVLVLTLIVCSAKKKRTKSKSDHQVEKSIKLNKYAVLTNDEDQEL